MPSRVMSIALRNTRRGYVNAMVRVASQQQQTGVYVSATSIGSIAPGQVFILPFHVKLADGAAWAAGDACAEVNVEVVMVSDGDVEDLRLRQQQLGQNIHEPNSGLFWTSLPPPSGASEWGRVAPSPPVRCRKEKNSSFRFTFVAHDGAAAEAAVVPPQHSTCSRLSSSSAAAAASRDEDSCPIVVTLHGTGVSCSDAADAYVTLFPDYIYVTLCQGTNCSKETARGYLASGTHSQSLTF